RDLSLSVVTSLAASLLLALTLMPVMMVGRRRAQRDGTQEAAPRPGTGHPSRRVALGHRVAALYERGLMWCLARPRAVFAAALGLILLTALVFARLPREILPQVDEGTVVADVRL